MNYLNYQRAKRIIAETISDLNLNLEGLTVLTEVGSNYFLLTPIIASLARAKKVYAWTRDSRYGRVDEIIKQCEDLAERFGSLKNIEFAGNKRPTAHVADADIITNSGFIRPIDRELLSSIIKDKVVIPLMYEAWEWREQDIDQQCCCEKGILIGGTWENYEKLRVFDYCGQLAIKMLHEAGLEVFQNKIVVWSNDAFGAVVVAALAKAEARIVVQTTERDEFYAEIIDADAAFFCDYHQKSQIIGNDGVLDVDKLAVLNSALQIVHMCGRIDINVLRKNNLLVYPEINGQDQTMTFTLAHLGMTPVIKLQTGGLKVAECLYRNVEHPICQPILYS